MSQYRERYVAFIDILGFSSLVERSNSSPELLTKIVSVLEEVQVYGKLGTAMDSSAVGGSDGFFKDMFRMSTFSDSILISTKLNPIGLGLITSVSGIICNRLLSQGVFTRGALSKGNMIHTDQIAVGDGLIRAYKIESSTAIYPRVIFDDRLIDDLVALEKQGGIQGLWKQDFDGLWYLHILEPKMLEMMSAPPKKTDGKDQDYMSIARSEIEENLRNVTDLAVKAKITWLARYFNEHAGAAGFQPVPMQ